MYFRNNGCLCKSVEGSNTFEARASECDAGWSDVGSKCVFISNGTGHGDSLGDGNFLWPMARDFCQSLGGELASWADKAQWIPLRIFAREFAVTYPSWPACYDGVWTAATDLVTEGDWRWGEGGDDMPMDFGWYDDQPHEGGEDCGRMRCGGDMLMMDSRCAYDGALAFCQKWK